MILQISEDVSKIAIRTKSWRNQRYARDWQNLYLIIEPGQGVDACGVCAEGGSPWIVYGCWPGVRTGVDLMNPPRPDFPAFIIKAEALTSENTVVFSLPQRWRDTVPFGRYNGRLDYNPMERVLPVNMLEYMGRWEPPAEECFCNQPPTPPPLPILPPPCTLVHFDIDYGPLCHQHFIDRLDVEFEDVVS